MKISIRNFIYILGDFLKGERFLGNGQEETQIFYGPVKYSKIYLCPVFC